MALSFCEVMWLRQLLSAQGIKPPTSTPLYCYNQAALAIAENPVYHERVKHVDIDYCHFIRDQVNSHVVSPTYIPSTSQVADIFTKILPISQQSSLLHKLGVHSSSSKFEGVY